MTTRADSSAGHDGPDSASHIAAIRRENITDSDVDNSRVKKLDLLPKFWSMHCGSLLGGPKLLDRLSYPGHKPCKASGKSVQCFTARSASQRCQATSNGSAEAVQVLPGTNQVIESWILPPIALIKTVGSMDSRCSRKHCSGAASLRNLLPQFLVSILSHAYHDCTSCIKLGNPA